VTIFRRVNHLGAEPGTQAYSAWACLGWN